MFHLPVVLPGRIRILIVVGSLGLAATLGAACTNSSASSGATGSPSPTSGGGTAGVTVTITGGHDTNPVDNGRPVVLVASILGVPEAVFRDAFSHVTPAAGGTEPDPAQVQANKAALLAVLAPYGVTNDELDAASNAYRYNGSAGETWAQRAAVATATVVDGGVTAINVTDGGAGYSSTPTITVSGADEVHATAHVRFTGDIATNGSIASITLDT